jgi:hypothetical protein
VFVSIRPRAPVAVAALGFVLIAASASPSAAGPAAAGRVRASSHARAVSRQRATIRPTATVPAAQPVSLQGVITVSGAGTVTVLASRFVVGSRTFAPWLVTVALPAATGRGSSSAGAATGPGLAVGDQVTLQGHGVITASAGRSSTVRMATVAQEVASRSGAGAWFGTVSGLDAGSGRLTVQVQQAADALAAGPSTQPLPLVVTAQSAAVRVDDTPTTVAGLAVGDPVLVLGQSDPGSQVVAAQAVDAFAEPVSVIAGPLEAVAGRWATVAVGVARVELGPLDGSLPLTRDGITDPDPGGLQVPQNVLAVALPAVDGSFVPAIVAVFDDSDPQPAAP